MISFLIFLKKTTKLWIATDGGGINILDFQTMKFSHLKHISDDEQSLPNNSIYGFIKIRWTIYG